MPRKAREFPWLDTRDGAYYVYWYDAVGKRTQRRSLRTKDPVKAGSRYAAFLTDGGPVYDGDAGEPVGITCGKALDDYFDEHARPNTSDPRRIDHCIQHLKAFFDATPAADIDIPLSRAYVAARKTGVIRAYRKNGTPYPTSGGTLRRELATLMAALNHSVKWKRLKRDELPIIELPEQSPPKPIWFFQDELDRLFEAAPIDTCIGAFIRLAYYTAARRNSIERLSVSQVSLERGRITLAKPGERKTNKRRPVVPIDPRLRPTVEHLLLNASDERLLGKSAPIAYAFRAAVGRAGMETLPARDGRPEGRPTPHTLRHTRATHLLQAGKSPWAVASLLGDDVTTVINTYGHHCPSYLDEILADPVEVSPYESACPATP